MANIIAVIWDFDKTLLDGYMQDPIFKKYNYKSSDFWNEVNSLPDKYLKEQNVKVNKDTIYLNYFIKKAKDGTFKGLNNNILKELGKELKFYNGVPEIFEKTKKLISDNAIYNEYNIKVEHYIVSTGMAQMIKGSCVMPYVEDIWGCELIEEITESGDVQISDVGYTIDNTTKTRALFEINKGVNKHKEIDVNSNVPEEMRRVPFENMIYIADGPSDIPAFSVINKNGGATFAIYPKQNYTAFKEVEKLRMNGRINMYAEADYREGTTSYMWITNKIIEFAEKIRKREQQKLISSISDAPRHLTE